MNPTIPARVQTRNRADRRLQSMTMTAAVVGIAATGVFGYAAALTYTGTTNAANAANPQTGIGNDQQPLQVNGGTSGQTGGDDQGTTVNPFFGGQQVTPPTTSRKRQSHVSSGSS
ncbi:MAG TPA: hypothetical protein VIR16_09345 [Candidatus Limnocylindrales bacterium]